MSTAQNGNGPSPQRYRALAMAAIAAILVYFLASSIEIAIIERLRPGEMELTWISDGVLAVAFGVAVFLWLRLKWTRSTLSRLERERIVIDAQLSLAAEICTELIERTGPALSSGEWQDDRTVVSFAWGG